MITYKPLRHLLVERDMPKMKFIELTGMSSGTAARLWKDEPVSLDVIDRICTALDCDIIDVIEHKKEATP